MPASSPQQPRPEYPEAERLDLVDDLHGQAVSDPYRWLEDADDPRTKTWSDEQDRLFESAQSAWPGKERIRARVSDLVGAGLVTVPVWRGDRQFVMRRTPDQEHAVLLVIEGDGSERTLIDPMQLDATGTTTLDHWQPSKEGDRLAYQLSEGGTEESIVRVMDVASGDIIDGPIDRARYSPIAWIPGGEAYYYVRRLPADEVPEGEEQFHRRVWLHRVGTDPETDTRIFGDGLDATNYYGVIVSRDGRWLSISAAAGTEPRNDLWIADLTTSSAEAPDLVTVQEGVDAQTSVHFGRDGLIYAYTNLDAPRGRILVTEPGIWSLDEWRVLVPEDDEAVLEGWSVLDGDQLREPVLLVVRSHHAVGRIHRHDLRTGTATGSVPMPGLGTVAGMSDRPEGGHEAWFGYTDHTTPASVYHYDARTDTTSLWASAPGTVEVPPATADQIVYQSKDGTDVRMFVLRRSDAGDGPAPTILNGYGGFGVPLTPAYSATILAWVEAGGVYVVANLRGGGEEGEQWHRDGMRDTKQNVFDDFHAAAEWLIANGITTPEQLTISGGSNGGLLVGAALAQRPDLYAAVICAAPLLDMVRYEEHGLGTTWSDEYGSASDAKELAWLLSYSPYHHVREGTDYPATLFTIFDGDTRVDPLHARKMAAAMQHATSGARPVLVRRESDVGHGARAVTRAVELSVDTLAFAAA
ncbi:MAG TPA: prolyl oligopeptidase family serine peptidase, partial [Actinomycetes bacterium]|nr:prolyl oligopeptidase family serine peptidase [Actinomycetes bacterium]